MQAYDPVAAEFAGHRRPDERIARAIRGALGDARTVVNVGAGTGSYEQAGLDSVGVEPSLEMCRRRSSGKGPVVRGLAERLPFRDAAFDAAMAILTMHHWRDVGAGLREMVRVARERVVLLTWDPSHPGFWLVRDYLPQILDIDRKLFPTLDELGRWLRVIEIAAVPIPWNCVDGFLGAYWRRPKAYLDDDARRAISTFARLGDVASALARLHADLDSGAWSRANDALLSLPELDLGYRLVVARGGG
jgi:SAM-dependent methyltransferase